MQRRNSFLIGAATALLTFGTLVSVFGFRNPMHHGFSGHHSACHAQMGGGCDKMQETNSSTPQQPTEKK